MFSESIIKETIDEINSRGLTQEKKDILINILSSNDSKKIENLFNEDGLLLFTTPLAKELINDDKYVRNLMCLLGMESRTARFTYINAFRKYIDLKELFNKEVVVDFLKEDSALEKFSNLSLIYDNMDENNKKAIIDKYIENNDINTLYKFSHISNFSVTYAYDKISDTEKNIIKEDFFQTYYNKLSEEAERFMWNKIKDEVKDKSVREQLKFLKNIESAELKKEIFNAFNFENKLELIIDEYEFNVLDFVSEDVIFEKFKKLIALDKFIDFYAALTPEKQLEAIDILTDYKIPLYKFFYKTKKETLKKIYEIKPEMLDVSKLYELYKEFDDIKYLKRIKEIYSKQNYYNLEVLCEEDFVNLLNEEEKEIIANNLKGQGRITGLSFEKKFNDYFFRIVAKDCVENLKKNPDKQVFISLDKLIELYTEEEQLEIIRHLKITNIISDAVWNQSVFDNLMRLLEKNNDLLHNFIDVDDQFGITIFSEEGKNRFKALLKYIDEKDLYKVISYDVVKADEELKKYYIDNVLDNPSMVKDLQLFNLLPVDIREKVVDIIDIENLRKLIYFSIQNDIDDNVNKDILLNALYRRFDEYIKYEIEISYVTYRKNEDSIYFTFDDEHKKMFLEKVNSINLLVNIASFTEPLDEVVINKIISIYGEAIKDANKYALNRSIPLSEIDNNLKSNLISKMNFDELLHTYTYYQDSEILNKILEEIHTDFTCLISELSIRNINILLHIVDEQERKYIKDSIAYMLKSNSLFENNYKDKVKELTISDSINYLNIYKYRCIVDNQELVSKLLDSNPFLFKSLNKIVFNDKVKNLNFDFLNKLSKYNYLQYELELVSMSDKKLDLFSSIALYLEKNIENKVVYDKEISRVIEFLSRKESFNERDLKNINNISLKDIINYILCNTNVGFIFNKDYKTVAEEYDIPFENFVENKNKKCDELFDKTLDINKMKNIYLNKYFSISLSEAKNFYQRYVMNYEKVIEYATSDLPLLFINLLTKIINIDDLVTLRELYMTNNIYYELSDIYEIESIMSHAYTKSLSVDYNNKQNGTTIYKSIKDKDGNMKEYEMTELIDNFGLILHSTCAYGEMPLINNDYYDSWNYNPNTENHGICCSYITNTSYGTASVTGNGVMLGFTSITPNTVVAYSPYDLATYNNGFNISCNYVPYYTKLDEISDYTRHTHNEFNLERRVNDGNNFCLQPNSVVIFEDMDDNIKANSIKAYNDFKKHNPDIKLIYIDRVKIANIESQKLDKMINEYNSARDLNLLKDIINKYESNLCCSDFLSVGMKNSKELFNMNELFRTKIISNLLIDTLNEISESKDKERLEYFIGILEHEQFKFGLIDDKNPERKHTFKLYSDELKEKIQETVNNLSKENTKVI